jgi:hypothetical protein
MGNENIVLHYLPPINIEFTMNPRYPVQDVCDFSIQCVWLNKEQLGCLKSQLYDIWNAEKSVVSEPPQAFSSMTLWHPTPFHAAVLILCNAKSDPIPFCRLPAI